MFFAINETIANLTHTLLTTMTTHTSESLANGDCLQSAVTCESLPVVCSEQLRGEFT